MFGLWGGVVYGFRVYNGMDMCVFWFLLLLFFVLIFVLVVMFVVSYVSGLFVFMG